MVRIHLQPSHCVLVNSTVWFVLIAILDETLPADNNNPPEHLLSEIEADNYYYKVLFASTPSYLINITYVCWFVGNHDLPLVDYVGIGVSLGIVSGLGLAVGHELGHKTTLLPKGRKISAWDQRCPSLYSWPPKWSSPAGSNTGRQLQLKNGRELISLRIHETAPGFYRESWKAEKQKQKEAVRVFGT